MSSDLDNRFRKHYGSNAPDYDTRFQGRFAQIERDLLLELAHPRPESLVLDVGTGTARAALALAGGSEGHVIGLDLTPNMMRQGITKRDSAGLDWPQFACGNARQLPFASGTFDTVLSIRMLHLFPVTSWGGFIDEMIRVLRPGGTLLVEFDSPLAGCGWALARDVVGYRRGLKPRYYLWPSTLRPLLTGLEDIEVVGFWFPGTGRLAQLNPRMERVLQWARLPSSLSYLGTHVLVRARKPADSTAIEQSSVEVAAGD